MISRQTGKFEKEINTLAELVSAGETIFIFSFKENDYIEKVVERLKQKGLIVKYERLIRKAPSNNRRLLFTDFGEPIGIEILPQIERFVGWSIKLK